MLTRRKHGTQNPPLPKLLVKTHRAAGVWLPWHAIGETR